VGSVDDAAMVMALGVRPVRPLAPKAISDYEGRAV